MFCPKLTASRGLLLKLLNAGTLLEAGAVNTGGKDRFAFLGWEFSRAYWVTKSLDQLRAHCDPGSY